MQPINTTDRKRNATDASAALEVSLQLCDAMRAMSALHVVARLSSIVCCNQSLLHAACCPILHVIHCILSAVACCKYLWRRDADAFLRAVVDELDEPNTTPQARRMQCTTVTRHSTTCRIARDMQPTGAKLAGPFRAFRSGYQGVLTWFTLSTHIGYSDYSHRVL